MSEKLSLSVSLAEADTTASYTPDCTMNQIILPYQKEIQKIIYLKILKCTEKCPWKNSFIFE